MKVYTLDSRKAYLNQTPPSLRSCGGRQKFTAAVYQDDQAGKCLGFGCDTASVFHMMRIMEIGIRAVAKCLGVVDPTRTADRNWGGMRREIKKDMDSRGGSDPAESWADSDDREFFESVYASIDAVRVAVAQCDHACRDTRPTRPSTYSGQSGDL